MTSPSSSAWSSEPPTDARPALGSRAGPRPKRCPDEVVSKESATEGLGALSDAVEQRWQVLRTASSVGLSGRKDFKRFIRARNDFQGALTELNDAL